MFCFSLQVLFETFLILRLSKRYIINVRKSSCKVSVSRQTSTKLEISQPCFEEYSNISFHENPSSGPVPCGPTNTHTHARTHTQTHTRAHARTSTHTQTNVVRTDSETDVTKLIVAFRSFANAPKSFKYYTK